LVQSQFPEGRAKCFLVVTTLTLDDLQENRLVEASICIPAFDLYTLHFFVVIKRLLQHRGELKEIANQKDVKPTKEVFIPIRECLAESVVDPG
jgi:hypothetical protein